MRIRTGFVTVGIIAVIAATASAQQTVAPSDVPSAPAAQQPDPRIAECVQAQPIVSANLEAALKRLEEARQSNSAVALRAAADDLQAALIDIRARLEPCAGMQAPGGDPHAGHAMTTPPTWPNAPNVERSPATQPGTPVVQPGSPRPAPGAVNQEAPAPPAAPVAADAHAGHTMTTATEGPFVKDPHCTENVNPETAAQAFHDGRTYYFCSESARQRFVADPVQYLGMASGAAGDHAGHVMPAAPAASGTPQRAPAAQQPTRPPAAAADPHAGHVMPSAPGAAATLPRAPATDAPTASSGAADPHAGHVMPRTAEPSTEPSGTEAAHRNLAPAPPTSIADLECPTAVDPRTTPRMLYQGRMYYFCSEDERAAFASDPSKYALPEGEAAPAHAH